MTTSTSDTNWAEDAEVFLGTLEVLDPATALADLAGEDARSVYLSLFEDNDRQVISGQSDWLVAGRQEPSSVFRFHYHSRSPDRLHFMITGSGKNHEKKLGISRNGYLGLYRYASVTDYFKFEPLLWTENTLICHWRDHQGHKVRTHHNPAVATPNFSYLKILEGEQAIFRITRVGASTP
ncbi:TPA: hypothetical protein QEM96_002834 [Pseudomonas putida]|nr:hypothetical protein [Pseudomonas putida]